MINEFRGILREFEREISFQNSRCCGQSVSVVQCHTLIDVEKLGTTTVTDLANCQGLDKSTVSRTVDGLYKNGLVKRDINPESRRQAIIHLTESGKNICCEINRSNNDYFSRVFEGVSQEELRCFMHVFSKVTSRMKAVRSDIIAKTQPK